MGKCPLNTTAQAEVKDRVKKEKAGWVGAPCLLQTEDAVCLAACQEYCRDFPAMVDCI